MSILACALIAMSVTDMLLTWRALHFVLIALPPVLIAILLGWLIWKFVPRKKAAAAAIYAFSRGVLAPSR